MRLALVFLAILASGTFAAEEEQFVFVGTIQKIEGPQIVVKTPRGLFPIFVNENSEIIQDQTYHDLKPLKLTDEVSVRCQPDNSGKLVALKIWAKMVSFSGTVRDVRGEEIEVTTNAGNESKVVRLNPDTAFGTNRSELTAGKQVRIAGLDVGDGVVHASRIALYNTDIPAEKPTVK